MRTFVFFIILSQEYFGIYINAQEKLFYSWMIKLYVAIKFEDGEEYSVMQKSAHSAMLSEKKGMLTIECIM